MDNNEKSYLVEYNKTLIMIDNIRKLGTDTSGLTKELEEIPSKNTGNHTFAGTALMSKVNYKTALKDLKKFQKKLEQYGILINIYNSTMFLNEIMKKNINEEDIIRYSNEIIKSLEELKKCQIEVRTEFQNVFTMLLDTVYDIIKLEFLYLGKSKTLDYILRDNMYIFEINNRILSEIDNLKNTLNYVDGMDMLKNVLFEKSGNGVNTHYVNAEVFKALVYITDNVTIEQNIKNKLSEFSKTVNQYAKDLENNTKIKTRNASSLKHAKENGTYKDFKRRVIAIALSITILGGGTYKLLGVIKKILTSDTYLTNVTTIENGSVTDELSKYYRKLSKDYAVILEINDNKYDLTEKFPKGTIGENIPNISDFLEVDPLISLEGSNIENNYKVTVTEQNLEDTKPYVEPLYILPLFTLPLLSILIFFLLSLGFDFYELPSDLEWFFKRYLKNNKKDKEEMLKAINEAKRIIFSNQELKEKFLKFYNDNEKIILEYINKENIKDIDDINMSFEKIEELSLKLKK